MREQVGLCNGAGEEQGMMERERVAQGAKANPLRVLGGRHEHGERVGRNAKLRKKVKIPAARGGAFRRKRSVMLGESIPQTP